MIAQFNDPSPQPNEVAIVFVHGFTGDAKGTWGDIPKLLEGQAAFSGWDLWGFGYDTKRTFDIRNLWSSDASLEEISTMLAGAPELNKYKQLALVAHSMGGLVVQRALVKSDSLRARASHVIFLGTPSGGLKKAALLSALKQQLRDMNASGEFVEKLRRDWAEKRLDDPPFHFLAIAGERDQFVPPESSLYPFAERFRAVIPGDHITMLKTDGSASAPVLAMLRSVLTHGAAVAGARNAAALAVEEGKFQQAIDKLWPIRAGLDHAGVTLLAIALDARQRHDDAIQVLRERGDSETDALGVLAGRYKRRWFLNSQQEDFVNALNLYKQGFDKASKQDSYDAGQAFYHGINLAYLSLVMNRTAEAQSIASQVLQHCAAYAKFGLKDVFWRLATEGDAYAMLGQKENALARHQQAAALAMSPWQALSIEEQAVRIADLCGWTTAEQDRLADLYLPR